MRRQRVIVADDSQDIRGRISEMLTADYDVVAAVEDGQQLVDVAVALIPDLLVIDISMPVLNGLDALQLLRLRGLKAKAVMVSTNEDPAYVRRALKIGAAGYVLKGSGVEDLLYALQAVLKGETFVSPGIHYLSDPESRVP